MVLASKLLMSGIKLDKTWKSVDLMKGCGAATTQEGDHRLTMKYGNEDRHSFWEGRERLLHQMVNVR